MRDDIERGIHTNEGVLKFDSETGNQLKRECLFWSFPGGKGAVQPWRRKLWERQNNLDRE